MLNDVTFGQYYPTKSFVHRLDPRLKLLFLIAYIVMIFVAKSFYGIALCGIILIIAIIASRVPVSSVLRSIKGIIFILAFTSILNIFFHRGSRLLWEWKFLHIYLEGVIFSVFLIFRLFFLVMASSILTLTTTPVNLCDGVESLLFPLTLIKIPVHVLTLIMSIALRFIPTLIDETNRIIAAQKARGAQFESRNIFKKVKAIIPVLIPLLLSSLRRAEELGDAMDARCYGSGNKRTKYKKLTFGWRDAVALIFAGVMIAGVTLLNIYGYAIWPWAYPYLVVL